MSNNVKFAVEAGLTKEVVDATLVIGKNESWVTILTDFNREGRWENLDTLKSSIDSKLTIFGTVYGGGSYGNYFVADGSDEDDSENWIYNGDNIAIKFIN